jgi:predicted O-linked N-acetylglucosamine transferase (SPINDLY family)
MSDNKASQYMEMAMQAKSRGNPEQALAYFEQAVQHGLESAELHYLIGDTFHDLGKLDYAIAHLKTARNLDSQHVGAVYTLAVALQDKGRLGEAIECYKIAETLRPNHTKTYNNMGSAYLSMGNLSQAITCFEKALSLDQTFFMAYYNLGTAHYQNKNFIAATPCFQQAIALQPDFPQAHNNLANLLKEAGQLKSAAAEYQLAIRYNPNLVEAYFNLANVLVNTWHIEEALRLLEQLLVINPQHAIAHSNYLFYAHYSDRFNTSDCYHMAMNYGKAYTGNYGSAAKAIKFANSANTDRKLKIGYVSPDFRFHPVGLFFVDVLASHDKNKVEIYCYYNHSQRDKTTERIESLTDHWRDIKDLSDDQAEALIRQDGIDILVDLAGHTEANRLTLFARKPAPVQVTWLGYFDTTGLTEIDYLITDQAGVPEANREYFTEKVWYLPDTRLCFSPPDSGIPVSPLPALKNGHITFGCFQNMSKVGDKVLVTWASILKALPGARLRWQCKQLSDQEVVKDLIQRLRQHEIDPACVTLLGSVSYEVYLNAYSEVDIVLDTFPYPGGTTTCEALWMGVPTLTLSKDTLLSRQGASLLLAVGLNGWITTSQEDYVRKAIEYANDIARLAELRSVLREKSRNSPLFNAPLFARNLEEAYCGMWHKWSVNWNGTGNA